MERNFFRRKVPPLYCENKAYKCSKNCSTSSTYSRRVRWKQGHDQHDRPKRSQQPQHQAHQSCVEDSQRCSILRSDWSPPGLIPRWHFQTWGSSQKMSRSIRSWEVVSPSTPMRQCTRPSARACLTRAEPFHLVNILAIVRSTLPTPGHVLPWKHKSLRSFHKDHGVEWRELHHWYFDSPVLMHNELRIFGPSN